MKKNSEKKQLKIGEDNMSIICHFRILGVTLKLPCNGGLVRESIVTKEMNVICI